jgi:outer membrane protein OmpA-like peptidoglycan-associated protein
MPHPFSSPIRRFVMRKTFIGVFVFVSAVAGVSACGSNGSNEKSKVGSKTTAAQTAVDLAQKAATRAVTAIDGTGTAGVKPDVAAETGKGVRATLVLGEGKGGFRVNSFALSEDAKAKIDELFAGGKVDLKDARFEIEGHTDNLGSKDVNQRIGLARAEAVKQYLCERYEILPDSISVVSFGLEKPVADNATEEGRAMNRRVVIKVVD